MLMTDITTFEADTKENNNALSDLGLRYEWLSEICQRALAAFNQATPNDAANAAGSYAYLAAVRAKRDILCPEGWEKKPYGNLEITRNPRDNTGIIVSSGDRYTGIKDKIPSTKNNKGSQTQMLVCQNHVQLKFWDEPKIDENKENELGPTWILLYHIDKTNSELRMELSLPIEMNTDELKVTGWDKRIILPSINFDDLSDRFENNSESEHDFESEIKISRRNEDE